MREWEDMFDAQGFVVLRDVIDARAIEAAKRLSDRLWQDWQAADGQQDIPGVRVLKREGSTGRSILDAIQGGHRRFSELEALRADVSVTTLLEPRLGESLVSVVDTLFFKPPNQPGTGIAFHRDAQFRRPPEKFRNLNKKYVQLGIPLEPHGAANGGLVLIPGSHLDMAIDAVQTGSVRGVDDLSSTMEAEDLQAEAIEMEPGDVVLWHPQTIHGSPPNGSLTMSRRFYVVGYMSAKHCDLGQPV
jgi:ectoine hydroxylase-related dioxygenase (phytanoyl-CoA dioxygenase family)